MWGYEEVKLQFLSFLNFAQRGVRNELHVPASLPSGKSILFPLYRREYGTQSRRAFLSGIEE